MQQNLAAIARCAQAAGASLLRNALVGMLLLAGLHARSAAAGPFDSP